MRWMFQLFRYVRKLDLTLHYTRNMSCEVPITLTNTHPTDPQTNNHPTPPQRKRRNPKPPQQTHLPNHQRLPHPRHLVLFPPNHNPQTGNSHHQRRPKARTTRLHTRSQQLPHHPPQRPQRPDLHLPKPPPLHRPKLRLGPSVARRRSTRVTDRRVPL